MVTRFTELINFVEVASCLGLEGLAGMFFSWQSVSLTIENPAFFLSLYLTNLTAIHFLERLQHGCDAVSKKSSVDQSELGK